MMCSWSSIAKRKTYRYKKRTIAISFISSEPDQEVFDKVQSRFEVDIPELPDEIDMSSYMST